MPAQSLKIRYLLATFLIMSLSGCNSGRSEPVRGPQESVEAERPSRQGKPADEPKPEASGEILALRRGLLNQKICLEYPALMQMAQTMIWRFCARFLLPKPRRGALLTESFPSRSLIPMAVEGQTASLFQRLRTDGIDMGRKSPVDSC
jgi:hypothetical protein